MATFRPNRPAIVYNELNNEFFRWDPAWGLDFYEKADLHDEERGVWEWDGLLLAGWFPEEEAEALGFPADRTVKRVPAPRT